MGCFEHWQRELFGKTLKMLNVANLIGQRLRFDLDASRIEGGVCNRCGCNRYRDGGVLENPEGYVIASDFGEDRDGKQWLRLFIRLPNTDGMGGLPHYLQFDGETWTWDEWCGGYPDDRHFSRHAGTLVVTTPTPSYFGLGAGRDDILCLHPSSDELEQMIMREAETGRTDKRLERARWCSSCQLMLEIIKS